MKKLLLATTMMVGSAGIAAAADLPQHQVAPAPMLAPAFTWTGFYIGANTGGVFGIDRTETTVPAGSNINANATALAVGIGRQHIQTSGFLGGAQIGYNYQMGAFVIGAEADFDFISNKRRHESPPALIGGFTGQNIDRVSNNFLSTARARIGYAWDRVLIYGTAGLAIADQRFRRSQLWGADGCRPIINNLNECHVGRTSSTALGYVLGAGVEYAVSSHWTVKAEYLYAGFNHRQTVTSQSAVYNNQPIDFHDKLSSMNAVRVGVNYKF